MYMYVTMKQLDYRVELKESNFPEHLVRVFVGRAVDMARQCVEPPLRRNPRYVERF